MRALLALATAAAALLLAGTANAGIAKANQFEGFVGPNSCGAIQPVTVNGPSRIEARFAATNAGGFLYAQILDSNGLVLSSTGQYNAPEAGTYGVRACFLGDDAIDMAGVRTVGTITTR